MPGLALKLGSVPGMERAYAWDVSQELPGVARARAPDTGRRPGGTWGSALTTLEFAAIRGVGFEPVGQVFGAAVYATGYSCPGAQGSSGGVRPGRPAAPVPERGDAGSFGPLVEAMYQARRAAL